MAKVKLLKNQGQNLEIFLKFGFLEGQNSKTDNPEKIGVIAEFSSGPAKSVQFCEIEEVKHEELLLKDSHGKNIKIKDKKVPQGIPSAKFVEDYLQSMANEWEANLGKVLVYPNLS